MLPVKLLLDLLLLELLPKDTQLLLFVESGDSAGLYCVDRGFKIADDGFVSAVEFDVTEVALLLPPALYMHCNNVINNIRNYGHDDKLRIGEL